MHSLKSKASQKPPLTASEVLAQAQADLPSVGHSPKGFLSRSHGFLPIAPPILALPQTHYAWDEAAAMLPQLFATQRVCTVLEELPLLFGTAEELDERYLWRAASILGYLAHAYIYNSPGKAELPSNIAVPWKQVNQRLWRPGPGISTVDYCGYNWQLKDPNGPRQVENLDVLVSWCGNAEEVVFLTSVTEMHSYSGALVDAATNLQDAILQHQVEAVKIALLEIFDFLSKMTFRSLLKIDPNPYSRTHVDPLIWSKAFASITAPINTFERGLGGSGTPIIQLLDALFERSAYNTMIARESLKLREWLPPYHRQFIESFRHISLSDFVQRSQDRELAGLYNSVFDAYAGRRGFLSMHRLKVYGFMELGFKIGRTETNSGFSGETEKRAWEELDDTLEETRCERYVGKAPYSLRVKRKAVLPTVANPNTPIHQVVLDIQGQGLQFVTGDRLGIFPQNSPALVQKTLQSLHAKGDEPIRLTSRWREALESITYQPQSTVPLRTFLTFAKLRPLLRSVGKVLLSLCGSKQLSALLEARQEDQIELWDVFELMIAENYDVKRFWKAAPWETESIARIVPPESFRIYSISSAPLNDRSEGRADELHLTVGRLTFDSKPAGTRPTSTRQGTASAYLVDRGQTDPEIAVQIFHPSRFRLPDNPARPIVMFAGGTGISPFRGFMEHRVTQADSGSNWLFLGTRTFADLPYEAQLRDWVARGKLDLRVAFSRLDQRLEFEQGQFVLRPGKRGYVDQLLADDTTSAVLWQYLQSLEEGGLEGYFYICGQANFAHTVTEALKQAIVRHLPDTVRDKEKTARNFFRRLVGQNRFMLDIFTTFAPVAAATVHGFEFFNASDVIEHNNQDRGYWTVIQGNVYDVSEFMYLHPGGQRLLIAAAGIDSTRSYEKVEHHLNSEVHSQLDLYKIGTMRRLNFKDVWGIAIRPPHQIKQTNGNQREANSLMSLSLHDFYRHWIRFTYQVVEAENSLNNNFSLRQLSVTRCDPPEAMSKLKAQLLLSSHTTFYDSSLQDLLGAKLELLWNITLGFCAESVSITQLPKAIAQVKSSRSAQAAEAYMTQTTTDLEHLAPIPEDDLPAWSRFNCRLERLEQCDRTLLASLKLTLREGLLAFEQHEDRVVERGKTQLVEALKGIPKILEHYYTALTDDPS